jgi:hypothetical protein
MSSSQALENRRPFDDTTLGSQSGSEIQRQKSEDRTFLCESKDMIEARRRTFSHSPASWWFKKLMIAAG